MAVAIAGTVNAVLVGSAWGHLSAGQKNNREEIRSIKKALGLENGQLGVFVRKDLWETTKEDIGRLESELTSLRQRLDLQ